MNARTSPLIGLRASTAVEFRLFLREPLTVAFTLALPLLFLFVLGGVFGNVPDPGTWSGHGPLDYYVPAYIGLVWAAVGLLALPVHLAKYREDGVLRRLHASPASAGAVFGAQLLVASAIAVIGGVLVVVAAFLTYDISAPESIMGLSAAWLVAALVFGSLGLLLGCIPTARGAQSAGFATFFVMMMLCGTGPPFEVMTSVMRTVSDWLPLTYVIRVLQVPWLGTSLSWSDIGICLAFASGSLVAARLLFRWE